MVDDELRRGLEHGFIDGSIISSERSSPRLLINDHVRKEKILSAVSSELYSCDEFMFSVAFITEGGVSAILNELRSLEKAGIRGRIVASQYLNFTQPKALRKLASFKNIELRIVSEESKMHAKCYIFRKSKDYNIIIGSSNLTAGALCSNEEWNMRFSSKQGGSIVQDMIREFDSMFDSATPIDDIWIGQYSEIYGAESRFRESLKFRQCVEARSLRSEIRKNAMQENALKAIGELRARGCDRALLISATGTGKTYLSAFDASEFDPERLLFIAHRETILKKTCESYRKIIGEDSSTGFLTGNHKDYDSKFLFASIQTISQDHVLKKFDPSCFDYIVIDEVHHGGASTYQKVMNHFRPKFLLGMTATPERNDSFDIFRMFDYNVAYEIRLQQAMEADLICPFHYFGIDDIWVDGRVLDDKADFRRLTSDERVWHIIDNIRYYGYHGDKVRGVVFCNGVEEAKELATKFRSFGYRTEALTSDSSQDARDDAIRRLESDSGECLDYIFVFDLFNEGVDIPSINQIVMLRPTKSPIVFVQQLGRGLRKYDGKEYVVVIDFIGNYDHNYMIPIALSGDRSYNKDNVRRFVSEGNREIPGTSIISFEAVTKRRIYESIDRKDFNELKIIRDAYSLLKKELGRIPKLSDFEKFGSVDALKFVEDSKFGSYHNFLVKYEEEYKVRFTDQETKYIEYLSYILCPGKRIHELEFMGILLDADGADVLKVFKERMVRSYSMYVDGNAEINIINVMSGSFFDKFKKCALIEEYDGTWTISRSFASMLENADFRETVQELYEFGMHKYVDKYQHVCEGTNFALYQKYTYADICRLLNWSKDLNGGVIGGYRFDEATNTLPVIINYVKGKDVPESQRYEDHFLNPSVLIAAPKSTDKIDSSRISHIKNMEAERIFMPLFVRKSKNDKGSKELYYLGGMSFDGIVKNDNNFMIRYVLKSPVRQDIYDYLLSEDAD